MSNKRNRAKDRSRWSIRWIQAVVILAVLLGVGAVAGLGYAANLENHDSFCASCHTQPETKYFQRSQSAPVDLASVHAAKQVSCIQCHSGSGVSGRLMAMATVAMPDLLAYKGGQYHDPAIVTVPISDQNCLKCHAEVTQERTFNNHFHFFLPTWQAQQPDAAATCVDCHQSHNQSGDPNTAYLIESDTVPICQDCHRSIGG
ncbi:MAG: cytochrome c3 family protein [Anaerolineales bacterium]